MNIIYSDWREIFKIVFVSRYGSSNIGDELIVRELEKNFVGHSLSRFNNSLEYYQDLNEAFQNNKISNTQNSKK